MKLIYKVLNKEGIKKVVSPEKTALILHTVCWFALGYIFGWMLGNPIMIASLLGLIPGFIGGAFWLFRKEN